MTRVQSTPLLELPFLGQLPERLVAWTRPETAYVADLLAKAQLESGTRFLDVGCGSGLLLAEAAFREPGAILVGLDADQDSIDLARARARTAPGRIRIESGRAEALPFADDCFDVAACTLALAAMSPPARVRALAECMRVLRSGGRMLVAERAPLSCALARRASVAVLAVGPRWLGGYLHDVDVHAELVAAGFLNVERSAAYCTLSGRLELFAASAP